MGFSISWLGVQRSRADTLRLLGFRDTGVADEANEAPFSIAELPTGWSVVWSNDFEYGAAPHLNSLSAQADILACQIQEHIMYSACHFSSKAHTKWSIWHDSQGGVYDLHSTGTPPSQLTNVEAKMRAEQEGAGGLKSKVDYIFDVPVDVAFALTGYRHDRYKFPWGEPKFNVIVRSR